MRIAKKHDLPQSLGLISFRRFNNRLGLSVDHAASLMTEYSKKLYKSGRHQMNINEFTDCQQVTLTPRLRELFDICWNDETGTIIFREYVMLYMLISLPSIDDEALKAVFECFDGDQDGNVQIKELHDVLHSSVSGYVNLDKLHDKINLSLPGSSMTYEVFHRFCLENQELANLLRWCLKFSKAFPQGTDVNGNGKTIPVTATESTDSLKHRSVPNGILN
jgi:Ca2+-binding EF-hand superfamily protein